MKILRPNCEDDRKDVSVLKSAAASIEKLIARKATLQVAAMVENSNGNLKDELDLMVEAANATQLRPNFAGATLLIVPEIIGTTHVRIMVMQRISARRSGQSNAQAQNKISQAPRRTAWRFSLRSISRRLFYAICSWKYSCERLRAIHRARLRNLGTLNEIDKILAQNSSPFCAAITGKSPRRTSKRLALPKTNVLEFETAIRAGPSRYSIGRYAISFARLLCGCFRFRVNFPSNIQPQLTMLQKTLPTSKGLGRRSIPTSTSGAPARPYLERWMSNSSVGVDSYGN